MTRTTRKIIDTEGLPASWWAVTGRLEPSFGILEDRIPADLLADADLERPDVPEALTAWFRSLLDRLAETDELMRLPLNPELAGSGGGADHTSLEIYLCSRTTMDILFDAEGALGLHVISTPDGDPFGDEAPCARVYRIAMVFDAAELLTLVDEEAAQDAHPARHLSEYIEAWLATLFHEIEHVRLFAQNAALLPPAEVETLSEAGMFAHDVFDASTGYGIRPLLIDGQPIWSDTMEDARVQMETHVEERGRRLLARSLHGALDAMSFLQAAGLDAQVASILDDHS